jgi:hypothetical protein
LRKHLLLLLWPGELLCYHLLFQQLQHPSSIINPTAWGQPRGGAAAAAANITSCIAPSDALPPVLQQHPHVWQEG